jgi:hypothetical protein
MFQQLMQLLMQIMMQMFGQQNPPGTGVPFIPYTPGSPPLGVQRSILPGPQYEPDSPQVLNYLQSQPGAFSTFGSPLAG